MSNTTDGRVIINIESNANSTAKEFENLDKQTCKYGETLKELKARGFSETKKTINLLKKEMNDMALSGLQNTKIFIDFAREVRLAQSSLNNAKNIVNQSTSVQNKLRQTIKGLNTDTNNSVESTKLFGLSLKNLSSYTGAAIAGLAAFKLKDLTVEVIKTAGAFETLTTDFKILTGNNAVGEALTKELVKLANVTPMTTEGLARNAQTLLSFGETTKNILPDLQLLGDITGGNRARMDAMTLAFAQVGSTGKLMGQDLHQMINAGFNPLQAISEKTGKSIGTLQKEMQEGKIAFSVVKQAMVEATAEGGRFYGRMEEQSKTLDGRLSTLTDTWTLLGNTIGQAFLPAAKNVIISLTEIGNAAQWAIEKLSPLGLNTQQLNNQAEKVKRLRNEVKYLETSLNNTQNSYQKWNLQSQLDKKNKDLAFNLKQLQTLNINNLKSTEEQRKAREELKNSLDFGGNGFKDSLGNDKDKKSKRDTLQSRMSEIQDKLQKLALAGKQNTAEFANLTAQYNKYKNAVDSVNNVLGKDAFELLNFKASESAKKLQELAASGITTGKVFEDAKKAATDYAIKLDKIADITKLSLSPYDALNDKIQQLQKSMQKLSAQPVVDMGSLKNLKSELVKYSDLKKQADRLMETDPQNIFNNIVGDKEKQYKDMVFSNALNPGMFTQEQIKEAKNQFAELANYQKAINAQIASSAGLDWTNLKSTISTDLASALTTPLQEGENAFERFGNVGLNIIQSLGEKMLETFVFDKVFNELSQKFTSGVTPALQASAQTFQSMAATAPQAAAGIAQIGATQTAAIASFKASSAALTGSISTYNLAALNAQKLAASITQAAIAQAAYSAGLVPIAGAALAPAAALATGASIGLANMLASAGMLTSRVTAFAKGGVVDSPSYFPMRNGTGLMGEAGSEAIMPLRRTSDGRLGVEAANMSQPNINIYNQSNSQIETVQRPDGDYDIFIRKVNNALNNERTNAGFTRAMQRNNSRGIQAC